MPLLSFLRYSNNQWTYVPLSIEVFWAKFKDAIFITFYKWKQCNVEHGVDVKATLAVGIFTCKLSFNCGISILNLWTGSKSCCWLNCCNAEGCCRPGCAIGPPGWGCCCWDAILTDYSDKPEEDHQKHPVRYCSFQIRTYVSCSDQSVFKCNNIHLFV